jgi:hypothetical protein
LLSSEAQFSKLLRARGDLAEWVQVMERVHIVAIKIVRGGVKKRNGVRDDVVLDTSLTN